jgi:hypothetical protein
MIIINTRRMLRYAPRFHEKFPPKKFSKKIFTKKNFKKKILKISVNFFFKFFFVPTAFYVQFGVCLQKFGGSRPAGLGGDKHGTNST